MNVSRFYRKVLKQLYVACKKRPHFILESRFLLSCPIGVDQFRNPYQTAELPIIPSEAGLQKENVLGHSFLPVELSCLCRPVTEGLFLDRETLFFLCRSDLRAALAPAAAEGSEGGGGINTNAPRDAAALLKENIVRQTETIRFLFWLHSHLAAILSRPTATLLAELLAIQQGPQEEDCMPDDFEERFAAKQRAAKAGPADGHAKAASGSSGEAKEREREKGKEDSTVACFSAGALGRQLEHFNHQRTFDMVFRTLFLDGYAAKRRKKGGTVNAKGAESSAEFQARVHDTLPRSVTARNEDIKVTVTARPLDPEYADRHFAGSEYFSDAHKHFMVSFAMEPLQKGKYAQLINTYFLSFDTVTDTVKEQMGFMPLADVRLLAAQRDRRFPWTPTMLQEMDVVWESEGAEEDDEDEDEDGDENDKDAEPLFRPKNNNGYVRKFDLLFRNSSNGPSVLKGLLYYKVGNGPDKVEDEVVKVIPFGPVKLEI